MHRLNPVLPVLLLALAFVSVGAGRALADAHRHGYWGWLAAWAGEERHERGEDEGREGRGERHRAVAGRDAVYDRECGACHLPYPPAMLPRESWQRLLGTLDDHFGENATLDADTLARLRRYLVAASSPAGLADPPVRITALPWFRNEHGRISRRVLEAEGVRSLAQCAGCHATAPDWRFGDDSLKRGEGYYRR